MKVYNKGTRPIVFKNDLTGRDAIHPGKSLPFEKDKANALIKKHDNACSESEFKATKEPKPKVKK